MPILGGSSSPTVTETATANGVTITVTSENDSGRMAIDLTSDGAAGRAVDEPVVVQRRDRNGTSDVRSFSAGTILWVAGTPVSVPTQYDYEARQELETDYIVTDLDGLPLVDVRVTIPSWLTWLKNPGKPHLNLQCEWWQDDEYERDAPQSVLRPRGAKYPIVLSERRYSPVGQIQLLTLTDEDARSMTSLLADGQPLMVDVAESLGVPIRYVSVGRVRGARETRMVATDGRLWTLEVTEVDAPIGLPAGQEFTYTGLSSLVATYRALPATFATYDDMALGLES